METRQSGTLTEQTMNDMESTRPYDLCGRTSSDSSSTIISDSSNTSTILEKLSDLDSIDLEKGIKEPLPQKPSKFSSLDLPLHTDSRVYRWLRWNFFSTYRRIFTIVFLTNLGVLVALTVRTFTSGDGLTYSTTLTSTSVNLLMSIISRQEHIVNSLFVISTAISPNAPLWARKLVAKVYAYGGLHSGCAVAAVFWYIAFSALVSYHAIRPPLANPAIVTITCANVALLIIITAFSHPRMRSRLHNWFEMTHRFAGWTIVALFWAQTIIMASLTSRNASGKQEKLGHGLLISPSFWCLIIITICIAYPWTRLRKRKVVAEPLSTHAIRLHFAYKDVTYCQSIRLATNPLKETHAFATIARKSLQPTTGAQQILTNVGSVGVMAPTANEKGFSVVVSKAGDWTSSIISNPPKSLYIRGTPTYGVLRIAVLFKPVLIVATGSGVGPCLSLFRGRPDLQVRILWSTPSPVETYGEDIVNDVKKADPAACIIDTRKCGRPDLVAVSYSMWKRLGCEAVVLISNPTVTKKVIYELETRGVPAFAPIFDS